jgi:hypothetical protein
MNEVDAYPTLGSNDVKYKIARFSKKILANIDNVRDSLFDDNFEEYDMNYAQGYSMVRSIMSVYQLTYDDIIQIATGNAAYINKLKNVDVKLLTSPE